MYNYFFKYQYFSKKNKIKYPIYYFGNYQK